MRAFLPLTIIYASHAAHTDGKIWKKIYSQTQTKFNQNEDFKFRCSQVENGGINNCVYNIDHENFIDLTALNDLQKYRFKILWTGVYDMFGFETFERDSMEWVQMASPTSATEADMNPSDVTMESAISGSQFRGLSLSSSSNYLFDGTNAATYSFYVIGYQAQFQKPPAYIEDPTGIDDMTTRRYASKVELFLEIGDTMPVSHRNLIQQFPILHQQWVYTFDVKDETDVEDGVRQILSIGCTSCDNPFTSESVSGITSSSNGGLVFYFKDESELTRLQYIYDNPIPRNEWITIEVSQFPIEDKYVTTVRINGVVVKKITREESTQSTNVSLRASGESKFSTAIQNNPINGEISNLKLTTFALGTATCTEEAEKTTCNCTNGYELVQDGNVFTCKISPKLWKKVYSQNMANSFRLQCTSDYCNHLFSDNNFIDFGCLTNFDNFRFKVVWTDVYAKKEHGSRDHIIKNRESMEWNQIDHPLSATNTDMNPTNILLESGETGLDRFNGLSMSQDSNHLLDGEVPDDFWYAIGPDMHKLPAYYQDGEGTYAEKTELYLFIEGSTKIEWEASYGGGFGFVLYDAAGFAMYTRDPQETFQYDSETLLVPRKVQQVMFITDSSDGFVGTFKMFHDGYVLDLICKNCENGKPALDKIYLDMEMNEVHENHASCKESCIFEIAEKENGGVIVAKITVVLNTAYTIKLSDPNSPDHKAISTTLINGIEPFIHKTAVDSNLEYKMIGVTFTPPARRRRQTIAVDTIAMIEVHFTSINGDIDNQFATGFGNNLLANVNEAISNDDISIIDQDQVAKIDAQVKENNLVDFPCPSNECWDYTETDGCTLKATAECGSVHICKHDGISLEFTHELFGTKTGAEFDEDDSCFSYNSADSTFYYEASLGECGQEIAKEGEYIKFKKTFNFGGDNDGIDLDGISIFTQDNDGVDVTFVCRYLATSTVTSVDVSIKRGGGVSGLADGVGSLSDGLELKYYTNSSYLEEVSKPVTMGASLYPMISWSVVTLQGKVGFYVKQCNVQDVGQVHAGIAVISQSCYAQIVRAEPLGDARSKETHKFVWQQSQFTYKSFAYSKNSSGKQKLVCAVEFCIYKDGKEDCDTEIVEEQSKCPFKEGYSYSPYGVAP